MTALTNAEKQKAHRRRMADKMARMEKGLREIVETANRKTNRRDDFSRGCDAAWQIAGAMAFEALNPTDPAES